MEVERSRSSSSNQRARHIVERDWVEREDAERTLLKFKPMSVNPWTSAEPNLAISTLTSGGSAHAIPSITQGTRRAKLLVLVGVEGENAQRPSTDLRGAWQDCSR